jgi:ribonuclease J
MFVATTFGSNVARLKTLAEAARGGPHGLRAGPVDEADAAAAQETGVLTSFPQR